MMSAIAPLPTGFVPPQWCASPHLQSILPTVGIRRGAIKRRAQTLLQHSESHVLECGDGVRLLGHLSTQTSTGRPAARDMVVLLHGWEGSAESSYVLSLGSHLFALGCDVFRLNLRDHGPSHHLNEGVFHSCLLDEVIGAVASIQRLHARERLSIAGFSLGGNFALRVAVAAPSRGVELTRAIGVCPVLRPHSAIEGLDRGWFFYRHYFLYAWKRSLRRKQALFPKRYRFERILQQSTITGMTELMLEHYSQFATLDDYLSGYALTGDRLAQLQVPAHILFALDDPIIPAKDLDDLAHTPMLNIIKSPVGGHCGFMDGWLAESWADRQIAQLMGLHPA